MIGLARSGKSTWIEKNKGNAFILEPDWIRRNIFGHSFFKPAEQFIWALNDSFLSMLCSQKKDVIIDATNLTPSIRRRYSSIAKEYGYKIRYVWIKTSLETCLKRNRLCPKNKRVPVKVIKIMNLAFMKPELDYEKYDELIEINNE